MLSNVLTQLYTVGTWSLGRSMSGTLACSGVEDMSRCDEDSKILLLLLPVSAKLTGGSRYSCYI